MICSPAMFPRLDLLEWPDRIGNSKLQGLGHITRYQRLEVGESRPHDGQQP
jgi:hypothetical protein